MAKFNSKIKKNWKKVLTIGLSAILVGGAVFGIVRISEKTDDTHKKISLTYEVGGINEKGVYEEREDSIYTKNAFGCQGLRITADFEVDVSYQVFFYNADKEFLESTSVQAEDYEGAPSSATYARLMIMPEDDEKILWYEVGTYANQLTIEVSKEQTKIETDSSDGSQDNSSDGSQDGSTDDIPDDNPQEIISENLFIVKGYGVYNNGLWVSLPETSSDAYYVSENIDISGYDKLLITMPKLLFESKKCNFRLLAEESHRDIDESTLEHSIEDDIVSFAIEDISSFSFFRCFVRSGSTWGKEFDQICIYGVNYA